MKRRTGVYRTIRHGRVKIGGQWFYPDKRWVKYDGCLDGMRYLFARYLDEPERMINMWGSEKEARAKSEAEQMELAHHRPEVVNGMSPWDFWYAEGVQNEH